MRYLTLISTLILLACSHQAAAQPSFPDTFGSQPSVASAPSQSDEEAPPVQVSIQASATQLAPGAEGVIAVVIDSLSLSPSLSPASDLTVFNRIQPFPTVFKCFQVFSSDGSLS